MRSSVLLQVESDPAPLFQDVASQRSTRIVWTGLGSAVLLLVWVAVCALSPHAVRASTKPSRLVPDLAFTSALPALSLGGIRLSSRERALHPEHGWQAAGRFGGGSTLRRSSDRPAVSKAMQGHVRDGDDMPLDSLNSWVKQREVSEQPVVQPLQWPVPTRQPLEISWVQGLPEQLQDTKSLGIAELPDQSELRGGDSTLLPLDVQDLSIELQDAFGNLDLDISDIFVNDPDWEIFAEDFKLVDLSGIELQGVGTVQEMLKSIRQFRSSLETSYQPPFQTSFLVDTQPKWLALPDGASDTVLVADWDFEIATWDYSDGPNLFQAALVELWGIPYPVPVIIAGEVAFRFNPEGKITSMKVLSWSINGKEIKQPKVDSPGTWEWVPPTKYDP